MRVLLSPFCKPMRNDKRNPKEYPWWNDVVKQLVEHDVGVVQLSTKVDPTLPGTFLRYDDLSYSDIVEAVNVFDVWLSCDSFLPHLCYAYGLKPGVVVWGKSDPRVFGYPCNKNLIKSEGCLRRYQFNIWEEEQYDERVFVRPAVVMESVLSLLSRHIVNPGAS